MNKSDTEDMVTQNRHTGDIAELHGVYVIRPRADNIM